MPCPASPSLCERSELMWSLVGMDPAEEEAAILTKQICEGMAVSRDV